MAAGFEVTKADLDRRMGTSVIAVRDAFVQVEKIDQYLDRMTDEELTTLGYTGGEIATIKSAWMLAPMLVIWPIGVMLTWWVAQGLAAQPSAIDFFAHGRRLTGLE